MKEGLYPYILPHLRELILRDQLFVKHGKVSNYLNEIDESEIAELRVGDFPAIDALAFAAITPSKFHTNITAATTVDQVGALIVSDISFSIN